MQGNPFDHFATFGTVVFLTGAFYFCFAHFREQFCIMVCPYGRLQSAMTDDDTIIIGYDEARGEPRGKASDPAAADCIDCRRCVTVCPTGIDIRNGLQLECIGCAACIDACDDIMKKLERPTGLVRYDSLNGLTGKKKRILRPRMILYAVLGCFGLGALTVAAMNKAVPYSVTSSRMAGPPFFIDETTIRNNYRLLLTNKRNQEATFVVTLESAPEGFELSGAGEEIKVPARSDLTRPAVILISKENYQGPQDIKLKITGQPDDVEIITTIRFVGPNPASLKKPAQ